MRKTYVGIVRNDDCEFKTLVLAEDAAAARTRVLAHCKNLGKSVREDELQIIAFGA
jgi:hypothetical protein